MKTESEGSVEEPGKDPGSVRQEARTCPVCGTKFFPTADGEFCPVCILNKAFGAESATTGELDGPDYRRARWCGNVILWENGESILYPDALNESYIIQVS